MIEPAKPLAGSFARRPPHARAPVLRLAALALAGLACLASAQAPAPMTIGILSSGSFDSRATLDQALLQGLREQGYVEGRNLTVVRRYGSDPSKAQAFAKELAGMPLDAILTTCTPSTRAMKDATGTTPIVMAAVADPVRQGIIDSLARPGRNITGTVSLDEALVAKRLQMITSMLPNATTVAVLANANNPSHRLAWPVVEREARSLKLVPLLYEFPRGAAIPAAIAAASAAGASALFVMPDDPLVLNLRAEIVREAARHRLPAFYWAREFVDDGGLASYGQNLAGSYRSAGSYMARIKKGAAPATLPVEQPTRFEMVVNLRTAQALDLAIPQSVLMGADDVLR
jgi:putative tryptophan/tyrosine transport system substrate-binding protein